MTRFQGDKVPEDVEKEMNRWRMGMCSMPQSYIDHHKEQALKGLEFYKTEYGITVHNTFMSRSRWFDGMMELHAIIQTRSGALSEWVWSDSNRDFMEKCKGGGSVYSLTLK